MASNILSKIRSGIDSLVDKTSEAADAAYNWLLPKSAGEYAKAGVFSAARLVRDLVVDTVSGLKIGAKGLSKGVPAAIRAGYRAFKGVCWDLPKAAYYRYQQNRLEKEQADQRTAEKDAAKEAAEAALQEMADDLYQAGSQVVEAVSVGASTIGELAPVAWDAASSTLFNGGELLVDTAAVAGITTVEGLKLAKKAGEQFVLPAGAYVGNCLLEGAVDLASRMKTVASSLGVRARTEQPALPVANPTPALTYMLKLPEVPLVQLASSTEQQEWVEQAMQASILAAAAAAA